MNPRASNPGTATAAVGERHDAAIVAAIPAQNYRSVLQPGCGDGGLTMRLATMADRVLALAPDQDTRERVAARLEPWAHVQVLPDSGPAQWPPGRHDLVVLVDQLLSLTLEQETELLDAVTSSTGPEALLVVAHSDALDDARLIAVVELHTRIRQDDRWQVVDERVERDLFITTLRRHW